MDNPLKNLRTNCKKKAEVSSKLNKYTESYVAFLDIMGMGTLVDECTCVQINEAFTRIHMNNYLYDGMGICSSGTFSDYVKTTIMSDSIVISVPVELPFNKQQPQAFRMLIGYIQSFLQDVVFSISDEHPIFFRGGISKGGIFHDHSRVFGPALNCSYFMETKKAGEMRIILHEDLLNDTQVQNYLVDQQGSLYFDKRDNRYFINFFHNRQKTFVERVNTCSLSKQNYYDLDSDTKNIKIFEKYQWLVNFSKEILDGPLDLE